MAQSKPNVPKAVLGKAVTSNAVEPVVFLVPPVHTRAVRSQMLVFLHLQQQQLQQQQWQQPQQQQQQQQQQQLQQQQLLTVLPQDLNV